MNSNAIARFVDQTLAAAQSDKDYYTNRCDGLDRQIDALVYDLYTPIPDEIKIVKEPSNI